MFLRTNIHLFFDELIQGDERFGFSNTGNILQSIDQDIHQMLVAVTPDFQEKGVVTGDEMAFDYFGDLFYFFDNFFILGSIIQNDPDESTNLEPSARGFTMNREPSMMPDLPFFSLFGE